MASMTSEPTVLQVLLVMASLSGNTRELGRMIAARLHALGHRVVWQEADAPAGPVALSCDQADLVLLGTWTDNAGRTPAEMKGWVADQARLQRVPSQVAVFGTGETQWGEEYYCGALDRLARHYRSAYPILKIEQMPHGAHDAQAVDGWTDAVLGQRARAVPVDATKECV